MTTNTSNLDRIIRLVVAAVAFGAAAVVGFSSVAGIVLAIVGLVMVATAAIGFCPLYRVFGISTCPVPADNRR